MKYVFLLSLLLAGFCKAQQTPGIAFEKSLAWDDVKAKAKNENKFIFVDAFTTWCGPCKYMAQKIFPQKEVGDLFNRNFINNALQVDTTRNDNEYVKSWYKDAHTLAATYKVGLYPTYLFFDQDGNLVHTAAGAASNGSDFIAMAEKALDTTTQYSHLKKKFNNGNRDSAFLSSLISAAMEASDDSLFPIYINSYLSIQSNLLTPENIKLIARGTIKSSDTGFNILLHYGQNVEPVIGKEQRFYLLKDIAFDEDIFPLIMPNGKKTRLRGGLSIYGGGEMNKNVDWSYIKSRIDAKYPEFSDLIILDGKLKYFDWLEDWKSFNALISNYVSGKNNIDTVFVSDLAQRLLRDCRDQAGFKDALSWASILATNEKQPYYIQTYALLLYQAGERSAAIKYMERCDFLLKGSDNSVKEILKKMKSGQDIE